MKQKVKIVFDPTNQEKNVKALLEYFKIKRVEDSPVESYEISFRSEEPVFFHDKEIKGKNEVGLLIFYLAGGQGDNPFKITSLRKKEMKDFLGVSCVNYKKIKDTDPLFDIVKLLLRETKRGEKTEISVSLEPHH